MSTINTVEVSIKDARPGDYIEAVYPAGGNCPFSGVAWVNSTDHLYVGPTLIRHPDGSTATSVRVTKITREVSPIPTEHGTLFWATVNGVSNVLVFCSNLRPVAGGLTYTVVKGIPTHVRITAADIDPSTVRLAKVIEA